MKTVNNNKAGVSAKRSPKSAPSAVTPEVITIPVEMEVVAPVTPIAPVTPEVVAPVTGEVIGERNLTSKRITPGTLVSDWRVVPNQRKHVVARYYVQGGTLRRDPINGRDMFSVAVEIPHTDLHSARTQLAQLRAELSAQLKSA